MTVNHPLPIASNGTTSLLGACSVLQRVPIIHVPRNAVLFLGMNITVLAFFCKSCTMLDLLLSFFLAVLSFLGNVLSGIYIMCSAQWLQTHVSLSRRSLITMQAPTSYFVTQFTEDA